MELEIPNETYVLLTKYIYVISAFTYCNCICV
jgi:hypothetical protein